MKPRNPPPDELTITDGTRRVGHMVRRGDAYECFDGDGTYLFKVPTVAEARAAIIAADKRDVAA